MRRPALAAAVAGIALSVLTTAPVVLADPLNPRDPDYCGNEPDIFFCTERRSTYPNPGEMTFLNDVRGRVPGPDAQHLAAGRAVCLELPTRSAGEVVADVANHLRISPQDAGQVLYSANTNICPSVRSRV